MKAAQITQYGGPEVVTTVADAAKPSISADEVLVEVHAAGVNPFDWKVRQGLVRAMAELTFPAVLGGDLSGIVAEVGANVSHVQVGDEVYGLAGALSSHGSFAEFAPVAGKAVSAKPSNVDFVQAAALPLVGVTAVQALIDLLDLKSGQKILIHGGSGGIGSVAIQIAKHLGAYVATTAGPAGIDFAKSLGADEVIDHTTQKFQDVVKDYDAVLDTVGGQVHTDSYRVLKPGGMMVSVSAQPDEALAEQYKVKSVGMFTSATQERLAKLTEFVESGVVTIHVNKTFPIEEAGAALAYLQAGGNPGKVVITVR